MNNQAMKNPNQYIIFLLDNRSFAIPVKVVERVIHAVEITVIPDSPFIMSGVINMEGAIISVISMRRCFNIPDRDIKENDRFIIVRSDRMLLALIADSVSEILEVSLNDVVDSENIFEGLSQTKGAIRRENGVIPILEINQLIDIHDGMPLNKEAEDGQVM